MLIKGEAHKERRRKRRASQTSGTLDVSTGGTTYCVVDPNENDHEQHVMHEIDGEQVWMPNRTAYVDDPEMAQAARDKGLWVFPYEKRTASGKVMVSFADCDNYDRINWSHKEGVDDEPATG